MLASQWAAKANPHAGIIYTNPSRFNRRSAAYPAILIAALNHFLRHPPVDGGDWTWWLQPPP